jgi:hypothetical protein
MSTTQGGLFQFLGVAFTIQHAPWPKRVPRPSNPHSEPLLVRAFNSTIRRSTRLGRPIDWLACPHLQGSGTWASPPAAGCWRTQPSPSRKGSRPSGWRALLFFPSFDLASTSASPISSQPWVPVALSVLDCGVPFLGGQPGSCSVQCPPTRSFSLVCRP